MVAAALLSVSAPPKARAANVFWDVNGPTVGAGGAGAWDTSSLFWFDAGSGKTITGLGTTAAYTFTAADTAYFTGSSGAVTMSNDITIGGLVFNAKGYSLGAGKTITLDGTSATPVIVANSGVLGDSTANSTTINSTLAGTAGFIKQGGGNLSCRLPTLCSPARSRSTPASSRSAPSLIRSAPPPCSSTQAPR